MAGKLDKKQYLSFAIDYFQDEDGIYTAVVPAIRGCVASGRTLQESYKNIVVAIESCLEARKIIRERLSRNRKYQSINIYRKELAYA